MGKRILILFLFCAAVVVAVWAAVRFGAVRFQPPVSESSAPKSTTTYSWYQAVEKVKADRGEPVGGNAPVEVPPELKHYTERYWFLATQVAEIEQHNIHTCQDFLDLAAMLQRGEMVVLPAVTESYVLYGVGQRADDDAFTSHQDDDSLSAALPDYQPLQKLAENFAGRSFDLEIPGDRQALKISMLSSLRPQALKILEEVASAYHRQFDRLLPISSLVRPEQYQKALRRVNRNAVLIETPPHSTGLAFDIDYRYMTASEQSFLMAELARMKKEGRIEVIRERNANYHVFAFIDATRPGDDLIAASLEKAGAPTEEAHHTSVKPTKVKSKPKVRASKGRRRRK